MREGRCCGKGLIILKKRDYYSAFDSIICQSRPADLCALAQTYHPSLSLQTELIDLSTVDVILISNYHCMMALPYITEHTGFTGTVYATEPTMQIGR